MRLFELSQNGLTYTNPHEIWGNDGRIHLQYEVSGYGTTSIVLIELCIFLDESCGVRINDFGTAISRAPNSAFLIGIFADCGRIQAELNELIRNGIIA